MCKTSLIAGNSLNSTNYNVIGNGGRESLKIVGIETISSQATLKCGRFNGQSKDVPSSEGKREDSKKLECDMVCSSVKAEVSKENIFYVYVYCNPLKIGKFTYGEYSFECEPFYVGKGHDYRWKKHLQYIENNTKSGKVHNYKNHIIRSLLKANVRPVILKIQEKLSHSVACVLEIRMIATIGRFQVGGPLANMTDGGEGTHGISRSGSKNGMYGVRGDKNPRFGKTGYWSGKRMSKEHAKKLGHSGKDNVWFGTRGCKTSIEAATKANEALWMVEYPCGKAEIIKNKAKFLREELGVTNPNNTHYLGNSVFKCKGYTFCRSVSK